MKQLPRLHAVTTREILEQTGFIETALRILTAGEVALHLRARGSNGKLLLDRARELRAQRPEAVLLVNDRVDVALIAGTGAHLPAAGLTPTQARMILGTTALLGRSVHGQPAPAGSEGVLDYWFYGHVFATASKRDLPPRGLGGLRGAVEEGSRAGLPVLAIGGVTPDRVESVLAAGAYGVAAISGIWHDPNPAAAAARYLEMLAPAGADRGLLER